MSGPLKSPFTAVGRIQGDVMSLERQMHNKAEKYEITTLNSNIAHLEHSVRELESENSRLWFRLEELEARLLKLETEPLIKGGRDGR